MKISKILLLLCLLLALICVCFTACEDGPVEIDSNTTEPSESTPTTYTITYNLNGGENAESNPATYTAASETITFAEPTRDGYDFAGWDISEIPQGSTGDKTITASWTPTVYNITYVLNGGTNAAANPATYTIESEMITFAEPTKNGYQFNGWSVSSIAKGSMGNKTVTASWTPIVYTITYDLAGGTMEENPNPTTYKIESEDITITGTPTKDGYVFDGWSIPSIPQGSTGDKTITASWREPTSHQENADGSITINSLPSGKQLSFDIGDDPQDHQITGGDGETIYGDYVSIELSYDKELSEQAGVPVYRVVSDEYAVEKEQTNRYLLIDDNYYKYYEKHTKTVRQMISIADFLADPTVVDSIPAETVLAFKNKYQKQSDDDFLYNGVAYHSYGTLTFSANNGNDYTVDGCVVDGEFYVLIGMQDATYYVVEERIRNIEPTFEKTLENVLYFFGSTITTGDLNVYSLTTNVKVPTYYAEVNGQYYIGWMEDSGEVCFEGLSNANVYGLETLLLPDGKTMYVLGNGEGRKYAGSDESGEYETVPVTYGYVKFGNLYAIAYTDGTIVEYPCAGSLPVEFSSEFRSYEEIFGESNLYGLQENGTYLFSAELIQYFKQHYQTADGDLEIKLQESDASNPTAKETFYTFKITVSQASLPSISGKLSFNYQACFDTDIRWVAETNSVVAVISGNDGNPVTVRMEDGDISVSWVNSDREDDLSDSSGLEVYSNTNGKRYSETYVFQDGKYYTYQTNSTDQYSPKATFGDLRQLIVVKDLTFYADGAYKRNSSTGEDTWIDGAVYQISFDHIYNGYFAQLREGKLWILTDAVEDSGKLVFTEDVVYDAFIASIQLNAQTPTTLSAKLPPKNGTIRSKNVELQDAKGNAIGSIDNVYYYISDNSEIYFVDYNVNATKVKIAPNEEAVTTLPAGYTVTSVYAVDTYTLVEITWYETSKTYAVKIDETFYEANLVDGQIQLSGDLIAEENLYMPTTDGTVDYAIQIGDDWYCVKVDYESYEFVALGDRVEGEVTNSESYGGYTVMDGTEYEVWYLEYTDSDYTQTEWNGKTVYRPKAGDVGYVEIIDGFFTAVQFNGDEFAFISLVPVESYDVERQGIDLSAYIEKIDSNTIRLKKDILSVLEKYSSNLFIGEYSISLADLKTLFGVSA